MDSKIIQTLIKVEGCNFFVLDKEYRYVDYSELHANIMKKIWNKDIQKKQCILDYIKLDEDKAKAKKNFDTVFAGEDVTIDESFGDVSFFRTLWRNYYRPVKDENEQIIGVLVFVTELTEHVIMQNRFDELKIFESVINFMQFGVVITDTNQDDMPIIFANDSFCEMTGYSRDEVLGKNCRFLNQIDRKQNSLTIVRNAIKENKPCEVELFNYKKDGTKYFSILQLLPLFDDDGNLIYYVGFQKDITDKVEKKTNQVLKSVASGLTHEINTAMVSLSGSLDMLSYDIEDLEDDKARGYMQDSFKEVKNSQETISKIVNSLHYLNSSAFKSTEVFNIYQTIQTAIELFNQKIKNRNIEVFINNVANENSKETLNVDADKKSIIHLLEILIENSIDAVSELEQNRRIDIDVEVKGTLLKLFVKDDGPGISKDIRNEIFKPLVKGRNYKGVGIGLTTAKIIVDKYKGKISFETSKEGTTFEIDIDNILA